MALFHPNLTFSFFSLLFLFVFITLLPISLEQDLPVLNSAEQRAVYSVLESINSNIPWRSLFTDDLCSSAPHGVVCDYFSDDDDPSSAESVHVTELSFGFVSDYTPNPPCSANSTLSSLLFSSFKYLRKLFFYKCFTEKRVLVPDINPSYASTLEELVLVDNPSLVGSLSGILRNFTSLRRVVLTGNGVYGEIPDVVGDLVSLEELTLSRNKLSGEMPVTLAHLKKMKVLDLSNNYFEGSVPEAMGNLVELFKMDLSFNGFSGKIPESLKSLQNLEFMDLSYNRFGNFGIPLFLAEMPRLRELFMSGNKLGGQIPEIWENLEGILGIGFSDMGLMGKIPPSMGLQLKSLCYLGLDNNKLEGTVPEEFGLLEFVNEINLEKNNLSGRVLFSAKFSSKIGHNLKLGDNPELCVEEAAFISINKTRNLGQLKMCKKPHRPNPALLNNGVSPIHDVYFLPICLVFFCMLVSLYS